MLHELIDRRTDKQPFISRGWQTGRQTDRHTDRLVHIQKHRQMDKVTERNASLITGHTMKCGLHKSHLSHSSLSLCPPLPSSLALIRGTILSVALDMAPSGSATATITVAATKLSKLAQMLPPAEVAEAKLPDDATPPAATPSQPTYLPFPGSLSTLSLTFCPCLYRYRMRQPTTRSTRSCNRSWGTH